ncbi:LysR family transcriptional regulator [Nocardioides KLBMP 9356]|uniref:LysR family transcriptional regulator n=1 Tax=Nocardioides potassii TaxID=2911371 RepID=A0ABS9H7B3_9ACTN|nr:LysR family transcriptional regulator [Nocardioides potassii]MCF6376344.1 LysR family transcriptional regulator [Nocardioides potassii]
MTDLKRLDWNLVPALDALLQERNVSRAARRLGVSQSAASGSLARLRRHFNDELLVRRGTSYELTSTAQRLAPQVRVVVDTASSLLASTRAFVPEDSRREFTIISSEYGQTLVGAALLSRVGELAPGVRISFRGSEIRSTTPDWLRAVDGWFGPRDSLANTPSTGLRTDRWVGVGARTNDALPDSLDIGDVANHRWVLPTVARDRDVPWRKRLLAHGIDLKVAATTESFGAVPFLVAGTDLVGIVQHDLGTKLADAAGVRLLELPWEMLPLNLTFWWDSNLEHDPAHTWLRAQILECMKV